jgi:heme/copper-type cytochrome/quinol oxidase subunit 4
MTKLAYNIVRLVLLALSLTFLSFYLHAKQGVTMLEPVVTYATKYLPMLLVPVTIAMAVLLLFRYMGKDKDEKLGFEDFFAGVLALVLQVALIVIWRAQGNEVTGDLVTNIPDIPQLTKTASTIGTLGVAVLELVVLVLYVIAAPDKRREKPEPGNTPK